MTIAQKQALRTELARHPGWRWDERQDRPQCLCGEYLGAAELQSGETHLTVHLADVIDRFLALAKKEPR